MGRHGDAEWVMLQVRRDLECEWVCEGVREEFGYKDALDLKNWLIP